MFIFNRLAKSEGPPSQAIVPTSSVSSPVSSPSSNPSSISSVAVSLGRGFAKQLNKLPNQLPNQLCNGMKIKGVQHSENLTEEQTKYVAACLGLQVSNFQGVAELRGAVADRVDRFVNRLNPEKPRERFFNQDLSMRRELMRKGLDRPGSLDFALPNAKDGKAESKAGYFELQRQGELTRKLSHGNAASRAFVLGLFAGIDKAKSDRVLDLMQSTHCHVYVDDYQAAPPKISILFGLSSNTSDAVQNVATFANRVGSKYAECRELADHFVDLLNDGRAKLEEVSGYSLGGGLAQGFLARVNGQIQLDPQPASILLDPQLLNNKQARYMTKGVIKGGPHSYDWTQPRGLMVTLNYPPKPEPNLVHIMKSAAGYKYPGLAELQLTLEMDDGFERVVKPSRMDGLKSRLKGELKGINAVELKTREPLANSYGYHGDPQLFVSALYRFTGSESFEAKDWWQIHGDKA